MELPGWWNYPKHCHHGHPSGPGRVIVSYMPCDCAGARQAGKLGHLLTVNCREPGCTSCWRKPRHDPATATPALRVGRDGLPGSGGAVVVGGQEPPAVPAGEGPGGDHPAVVGGLGLASHHDGAPGDDDGSVGAEMADALHLVPDLAALERAGEARRHAVAGRGAAGAAAWPSPAPGLGRSAQAAAGRDPYDLTP